MVTWDQIRRAFPDGKMVGGEWVCLCPVHSDKNHPNLNIKLEGGKLLATCSAKCNQDKVFRAVLTRLKKHEPVSQSQNVPVSQPAKQELIHGWPTAIATQQAADARLKLAEGRLQEAEQFLSSRGIDLQTARRLRFGFEPPYLVIPTLVDGEIVAVKLRNTDPKCIRDEKWKKFRRHEKTYWLFNREALTTEDWSECFVTESELDAAMMECKGHHAVSVDSAGHKLEPSDIALLKSYAGMLVLSPDTDPKGIECGLRIIKDAGLDNSLAIKTPTKDLGDLYKRDPAAFDKKLDELRENPVPIWQFGFRSVAQLESGPVRMIIKRMMSEGNNIIGAASGVGKTWFMLSQAKAICTGERFMGVFEVPEPQKVIYLIPESGDRGFRARCEKMRIPLDGSVFLCRTMKDGILRLDDPMLIAAMKDWHPIVFLDTAIRFANFKDENSSAENAGGLASNIFELLNHGAITVQSAHHAPKSSSEPDKKNKLKEMSLENMLAGTRDIGAMVDTAWGIQPDDGGKFSAREYLDESRELTRLFVKNLKPREFDPVDPFRIQGRPYIDEKGDFVILTHDDDAPNASAYQRAAKLIEKDPEHTSVRTVCKNLGISPGHFDPGKVPGWKWEKTSRTTGFWVPASSTTLLLPDSEEE
jgi:hypothetical protein